MKKLLQITPVPKPRMTRSDKWKSRPATQKYWAFKDELNLRWGNNPKPGTKINVLIFYMPMPKSWSKKKKEKMMGEPHTQTPDLDNLMKAFLDALLVQDGHVAEVGYLAKRWTNQGGIYVEA